MSFKKVLLASAVAAVSSQGFALEAMDDSTMSDTTGQDGLTITLATQLSLNMYIHDNNGFTGATDSGAIGLKGIAVNNGAGGDASFKIDIDAGANVAASPVLQVALSTTTNTQLTLGTLTVANSNRSATDTLTSATWGVTAETGTLMNLGQLSFGATTDLLKIQMGNEIQGSWMRLGAAFTGGLTLDNFTVNDAGGAVSGGGIGFNLNLNDAGAGNDLTTTIAIDANSAGLQLDVITLGLAGTAGGMDVRMADLRLGQTGAGPMVGDIEIIGLNLNGTNITVVGH